MYLLAREAVGKEIRLKQLVNKTVVTETIFEIKTSVEIKTSIETAGRKA